MQENMGQYVEAQVWTTLQRRQVKHLKKKTTPRAGTLWLDYKLGNRGTAVRSPAEASIQTGEGAGPPSYIQWIPGNIFTGVQRPGIEVDNKNGWSHNFTPPYAYVLCIQAMVETHLGPHIKCPLFVSTIKQNWNVPTTCTVKFQSQCTKESLVYGH